MPMSRHQRIPACSESSRAHHIQARLIHNPKLSVHDGPERPSNEGAMAESERTPRRFAKKARCAIYTRKSSEEGLKQAFNSLDAQREACAAFILSQKHEGWTVLPALYDDGGFSGGTLPLITQRSVDPTSALR
jgi:hypothetical protein